MASDCNGNILIEKLKSLGIDLGNLNENVFHSWFDIECEDTKALLCWLCQSIGEENTLSDTYLEE